MKEELIYSIVAMLQQRGVSTEGIPERLYILFKDVEVTKAETALAIRDDTQNEKLLKRFLSAKMVKGCTKRTIEQYGKVLTLIMQKFNKSVTEYTADDIRLYMAYRLTQDKISKVSVQNEIRYLRTFFSWMFAEELIPKNPMLKVDSIKVDKVKKKAFSELECEKLRKAARSNMESAIIEVLLSTGCRVSELCLMQRDEIDGDRIVVHGKGNKDRTCFLNAKAQIALQLYLSERRDDNPYIFPKGVYDAKLTKRNTEWYRDPALISEGMRDKSGIEAIVRRMGKRAGVENAHPHRFRRTCATFALQRGMPIELVSKMLGHEQLTTTQIYLDLSENDLATAHRKYVV